jgi:hypothetical protein
MSLSLISLDANGNSGSYRQLQARIKLSLKRCLTQHYNSVPIYYEPWEKSMDNNFESIMERIEPGSVELTLTTAGEDIL